MLPDSPQPSVPRKKTQDNADHCELYAICHSALFQASRATPNLTTLAVQIHQTLFASSSSLAAQQPRNHLTSLCLNLLQGIPFPLRSARLPLPLLPEVPCPPFYPLQEEHFNKTPCATTFLPIPIPCAVVGTQRILLAALPSPAPRSHLNHTLTCIHRSIPPSRLLALKHVYIMTLTPFRTLAPLNPASDLMPSGGRVDR